MLNVLGPAIWINGVTNFGYISVSTFDLLGPGQHSKNLLCRRRVSIMGFSLASSLVIPIFSSSQRRTPAFAVWASSLSLQNLNSSSSNFLAVGLGGGIRRIWFLKWSYSSFADPELLLLRVVGVAIVGSHSAKLPKSQLFSDSFLLQESCTAC